MEIIKNTLLTIFSHYIDLFFMIRELFHIHNWTYSKIRKTFGNNYSSNTMICDTRFCEKCHKKETFVIDDWQIEKEYNTQEKRQIALKSLNIE